MKIYAQALDLKDDEDLIKKYENYHKNVWPEMKSALTRNGWHNYSLFMRKDGLMFGYFEAKDSFLSSLEGMSKEAINKKWQDLMSPYFEIPEGAAPDQSMLELEEVFHID